jgi:hypothetical protein
VALTFDEQTTFCNDTEYRDRVRQAALTVARAVRIEGSSVEGHDLRLDFATKVLADPDLWKLGIQATVATDPDLTTTPDDAALLTAVQNAWDDCALVAGPV